MSSPQKKAYNNVLAVVRTSLLNTNLQIDRIETLGAAICNRHSVDSVNIFDIQHYTFHSETILSTCRTQFRMDSLSYVHNQSEEITF